VLLAAITAELLAAAIGASLGDLGLEPANAALLASCSWQRFAPPVSEANDLNLADAVDRVPPH